MLVKLVLLLFCCALISAKSLVQRDPRHEAHGDIKHAKLPNTFKDLIRDVEFNDVDRINEGSKVGADAQESSEEKEEDEEEEEESRKNVGDEEESYQNGNNDVQKENKEVSSEQESEQEFEAPNDVNSENKKDQKSNDTDEPDESDNDDGDDNDTFSAEEKQNKDDIENENIAEVEELQDVSEDESEEDIFQESPLLSNAFVGSEMKFPETLKFPKQSLDSQSPAEPIPAADDKLADKVVNFFALESLVKNFIPSDDSSLKQNIEETDEKSLIEEIQQLEKNNKVAEEPIANTNPAAGPVIDINLDDDETLRTFVSQAVPKNLGQFQAQFRGAKDFWQRTSFNDVQAKIQQGVQDLWQKTNFNDLQAKFQQGVSGLWQENIKGHTQQSVHEESKVGFGGWDDDEKKKLMFGDATTFVAKAVQNAQAQLDENGRTIRADNPPLTINVIPGTPVTFKLKYVEGAHTIDTYGRSKAIHYDKLYTFAQYKFTELRYYYDVIISPYNLYNIRKSITVILNDAPVKMNLAVEKDNKMNILALEFINPKIMVDSGSHRFVNYGLNYLINDVHPVIKQKLVEIVSRDSKLLLTDYLKDSQ